MTRSTLIPRLSSFLLVCGLALTGCSQGENESCQLSSDCDDGLICVRARGNERGTCETTDSLKDAGTGPVDVPDAAPLPPIDGAIDTDAGAAVEEDAG